MLPRKGKLVIYPRGKCQRFVKELEEVHLFSLLDNVALNVLFASTAHTDSPNIAVPGLVLGAGVRAVTRTDNSLCLP